MKNLIPQKAPDLLVKLIGDRYAYAINCSFPNSFRLLNRSQYDILQAVNGIDDVETLANRLDIPGDRLEAFLQLLHKTEIIGFGQFAIPVKPAAPKSLNFWIHTTNACNLGCSYCYIPTLHTGRGMTDSVRIRLLHKMTEVVKSKGIRHIRLRLAGGEPLGQFKA